jgi:hypothetical protein
MWAYLTNPPSGREDQEASRAVVARTKVPRLEVTALGSGLLMPSVYPVPGSLCNGIKEASPSKREIYLRTYFEEKDGTQTPAPNIKITLGVEVVADLFTGHFHSWEGKPAGKLSATEVVTDELGENVAVYTASEYSGPEKINASAEFPGYRPNPVQNATQIRVGIGGLTSLADSPDYNLIGETVHHIKEDSHYGVQALLNAQIELAKAFHTRFDKPRYPQKKIEYNDGSLPLGGMFDINGTWKVPHCDHRLGWASDVRTVNLIPAQQDFIEQFWQNRFGQKKVLREGDPVHFHVKIQ